MKHSFVNGFTLIELLVVIAILGILGSIGVPMYSGYVDTARVNSAQNNLRSIYIQQQEYYVDNGEYFQTADACDDYTTSINTNLFSNVQILDSEFFTYCITQVTVDDFTAFAEEVGGTRSFSITNNNVDNF